MAATPGPNISRAKGLPKSGIMGKIGVSASPAQAGRVWAMIEAADDKMGVYRSDDWGESWQMLTDNRDLLARPWYYMHIFADPQRRRHRLHQQSENVEIDRRRQELHRDHHTPRRQPRPLDRPGRSAAHGAGQRRRR